MLFYWVNHLLAAGTGILLPGYCSAVGHNQPINIIGILFAAANFVTAKILLQTVKLILTILLLLHLSIIYPKSAAADSILQGAQACTRHLSRMEKLYNIPAHWLSAIASTESGRYHPKLGLAIPWPWTINVQGKGYWFNNKQEAIQAVRKFQKQGISSIDVGCMQVNLHYHGHHFTDLEQAFDPVYNIAYAAKFLSDNYTQLKSWRKATAAYHSKTPDRGKNYYRKVYTNWQKVLNRLNDSLFEIAITRGRTTNSKSQQTSSKIHSASKATTTKKPHFKLAKLNYNNNPAITNAQKARNKGVLVIEVKPSKSTQTGYKKRNPPVKLRISKSRPTNHHHNANSNNAPDYARNYAHNKTHTNATIKKAKQATKHDHNKAVTKRKVQLQTVDNISTSKQISRKVKNDNMSNNKSEKVALSYPPHPKPSVKKPRFIF